MENYRLPKLDWERESLGNQIGADGFALLKAIFAPNAPEFLQIYRHRAGIEGTLSQGIRRSDLRQSRYVGLGKTYLQHILMAAALNLCRLDAWVNGIPLAPTRYSRFLKLRSKTR